LQSIRSCKWLVEGTYGMVDVMRYYGYAPERLHFSNQLAATTTLRGCPPKAGNPIRKPLVLQVHVGTVGLV